MAMLGDLHIAVWRRVTYDALVSCFSKSTQIDRELGRPYDSLTVILPTCGRWEISLRGVVGQESWEFESVRSALLVNEVPGITGMMIRTSFSIYGWLYRPPFELAAHRELGSTLDWLRARTPSYQDLELEVLTRHIDEMRE